VSHQRCLAHHTDSPPPGLGELLLCAGHYDRLTVALTGPAATKDHTLDATWGVKAFGTIAAHPTREQADHALHVATDRYLLNLGRLPSNTPPPVLVVSDGTDWCNPADYRPGGLARDWAALELREKTLRTGDTARAIHSSAEVPLPIDPRVADVRLRINHALAYWALEHADRQRLTRPALHSVYKSTRWLAGHIDWAARQPFAGAYVENILELRSRARHIIDLPQPRRTNVAGCIEIVDGRRCGGRLFTIARDAGDPTPVVIQCDTCTAAYDSPRWKRLRQRLHRAGKTAA
jgi:hypothetical protein